MIIFKVVLSILAATSLADLMHTTPGPANIFLRFFGFLDRRKGASEAWTIIAEGVDCHRCFSLYLTILFQLLSLLSPLYYLIAPAVIATKVSQLVHDRPRPPSES
jgi:hypothetical protein